MRHSLQWPPDEDRIRQLTCKGTYSIVIVRGAAKRRELRIAVDDLRKRMEAGEDLFIDTRNPQAW